MKFYTHVVPIAHLLGVLFKTDNSHKPYVTVPLKDVIQGKIPTQEDGLDATPAGISASKELDGHFLQALSKLGGLNKEQAKAIYVACSLFLSDKAQAQARRLLGFRKDGSVSPPTEPLNTNGVKILLVKGDQKIEFDPTNLTTPEIISAINESLFTLNDFEASEGEEAKESPTVEPAA